MAKNEICRLCNVPTNSYFSLLEEKTDEMLFALTSIKVISGDGIASIACLKCHLNLKLAYKIQQDMIKANERFLKNNVIKQDPLNLQLEEFNIESIALYDNNQCFICGTSVCDNSIKSHMNKHFHQEQKCDLCNLNFSNIQSFHTHNLINHEHENSLYQCDQCECKFHYKTLYDTHREKIHTRFNNVDLVPELSIHQTVIKRGEEVEITPITQKNLVNDETCLKTLPTKPKYKNHMSKHKARTYQRKKSLKVYEDIPQVCEICGCSVKNKACLANHKYYHHNKDVFKCSVCDKQYKKKSSLDYHERSAHGDPTHVCDVCGRKYFSWFNLSRHKKRIHLKLKRYVCEYCKNNFSTSSSLKIHKRQHTNETPFKCNVCGEGFKQKLSLKGHQKSKHGIEEPKTCKCKECGKWFASEWALKTHYSMLH